MSELKKVILDSQTQKTLWDLLHDQNEVVADVFGTKVKLTMLSNNSDYADMNDIVAEIEADPELQQMLLESEEDIKAGRIYTTEEAIRYIREYHSKQ